MKKELLITGTTISNKGNNYTVLELKEDSVIVEGAKGVKELKLSTVTKNFKLVKESKEESKEEAKTLVEEALEEAGISTKLGKIGEKVEASKEEEKEIEEAKEEVKEPAKEEVKEIITLRDIVEEIVREKLLILDLEYNPNNTFKNIRKKIRRKAIIIKELRLEGYGYTFKVENKEAIKEELLKILA